MTAMQLATRFAMDVSERTKVNLWPQDRYGIKVRNKRESMETDSAGALATITYEGAGDLMIEMTLETKWINTARRSGLYFEPYSSWQIAVWRI